MTLPPPIGSGFRPARMWLLVATFLALLTGGGVSGLVAAAPAPPPAEEVSPANRLFIQAMRLIDKADSSFDLEEEARSLREADRMLNDIVDKYPDSSLAVQLTTQQFVGDFDLAEFRNRLKALVCNDPVSNACFLRRIEELLPAVETPITAARWDWLSLAVAHHHLGVRSRAKEIMAPFVAAVRRGGTSGEDLFVARALSLIGEIPLALEVTHSIDECSTRIYNLTDISKAALWVDDKTLATALAEEAARFSQTNTCRWEQGLVVQALHRVGEDPEATRLFKAAAEESFVKNKDNRSECCSPELAVAAAEVGDVNLALNVLRVVEDENPWSVPAVIGRVARRGEVKLADAYAERTRDVDLRAEATVELIDAALRRKDRKAADEYFKRIEDMTREARGSRPGLLAQRAKAQRMLQGDERWRPTFLAAINAAERSSNFVRRDIGAPLLAVLVRVATGKGMLD